MALGALALLGALAGGLARLGWSWPVAPSLVVFHGPLMVAGFLGTVIGLERAVALGRPWAYAGPLASGLGALALMLGAPGGRELMTIAAAVMALVFVRILGRQPTSFTAVMALGALCWLAGQVLWLAGQPPHRVVYWWAGFLVLTIAGERLELTRLIRLPTTARVLFGLAVVVLLSGLAVTPLAPDGGVRIIGLALVGLAAWLAAFDVARRTVLTSGLPRYIATALLAGYGWLGLAGGLALRAGAVAAGPRYDALLHALFVGFVFSMIFGHAPIVVPAVLGRAIAYRPAFYAPLALLHASLALRLFGDLWPWLPARRWGGLVNALAILAFLATVARAAMRPRPAR